jgi:endonuclease YncB( thermonuclease family)
VSIRRLLLIICSVVSAMTSWAIAADLIGRVTVIDADTLDMHGQRIRLWGIDAPENDQLCRGVDSLQYRCGAKAANDLDKFIEGRPVSCAPITQDRYGRTVASCVVSGTDLADWLVRQGLGLDWPRYSNMKYAAAQREADANQRGMWSGSFVEPWKYRACIRAGGNNSLARCSDGD